MTNQPIILYPTAVFHVKGRPFNIVVCSVIVETYGALLHSPLNLYLSNGVTKSIVCEGIEMACGRLEITNDQGLMFSGDIITTEDLQYSPLISNLLYNESLAIALQTILSQWQETQPQHLQTVWRALTQAADLGEWHKVLKAVYAGTPPPHVRERQ